MRLKCASAWRPSRDATLLRGARDRGPGGPGGAWEAMVVESYAWYWGAFCRREEVEHHVDANVHELSLSSGPVARRGCSLPSGHTHIPYPPAPKLRTNHHGGSRRTPIGRIPWEAPPGEGVGGRGGGHASSEDLDSGTPTLMVDQDTNRRVGFSDLLPTYFTLRYPISPAHEPLGPEVPAAAAAALPSLLPPFSLSLSPRHESSGIEGPVGRKAGTRRSGAVALTQTCCTHHLPPPP
ncbi:hypothetical protein GGR56DRAFT_348351 [Xylariaceae sp. FL0804]|nr:hypothetical protein GGR56DRAFT_348351 [Xylariaceae sp. FL0804]